jgi:hypothetical protein|tara:strand:- start:3576 stop:3842 length:267 start_codon:yes stop_codon:yes gene_type:complete
MNELTEEQKEKAVQRYLYCKEYYKQYQKENSSNYCKSSKKYMETLKQDPLKLEEFKQKKKEYYQRVGKEKYERKKAEKLLQKNAEGVN